MVRSYYFYGWCWLLVGLTAFAQKKATAPAAAAKPAAPQLVVGIVVDQMRYDYLYKYYPLLGNNGFKRLLNEGFSFDNCQYNYVPTYTGPGHSCIFTGTTPSVNGIVANDWYERSSRSSVYCASDSTVSTVGSNTVAVGKMSPRRLLSTTIGDELRLATHFRSRVFGVALKDRSCILPAGRSANGAYWFDGASGNFVTSTYYAQQLPQWLQQFNQRQLPKQYIATPWTSLLPIVQYQAYCAADDSPYEGLFRGEEHSTFPHQLSAIFTAMDNNYDLLRATPSGNSLTKELALALIEGEQLGKKGLTDMLTISFSSPDYIGHQFGPQSMEVMDNYLRLDRDIADLLTYLDTQYGKNNVLVFLTADHGAAQNVAYMRDAKLAAGTISSSQLLQQLRNFAQRSYGDSLLIAHYDNQQIYLDHSRLTSHNLSLAALQQQIADFVTPLPGIAQVITATEIQRNEFSEPLLALMQRGYYAKRSGDVLLNYEPGWMDWGEVGTSHGSPFSYDTHVPLLWYGYHISAGKTAAPVYVRDIAATIALALHIPFTNGNTGQPLNDYLYR